MPNSVEEKNRDLIIDYIILNYQNLENFVRTFIKGNIFSSDEKKLRKSLRYVFDLDSDCKTNPGYDQLIFDIAKRMGLHTKTHFVIYSSSKLLLALESLEPDILQALQMRYGLNNMEPMTQKNISKALSLTLAKTIDTINIGLTRLCNSQKQKMPDFPIIYQSGQNITESVLDELVVLFTSDIIFRINRNTY